MSRPAPIRAAEAVNFVVNEARLLDAKRFDEWYDLFADEGRYWMPLVRGQQDSRTHTSLMNEDKLLLKIRVDRLKNARAFAQHPPSFCHHLLQTPCVMEVDASEEAVHLRTEFIYSEVRGPERISLAGTAYHHLAQRAGVLRIVLKRVDLLECELPLPSIQLFV